MLGEKFYKENYSLDEYSKCAEWCNNNGATIVDQGEYYECVAIPAAPPPSVEEQIETLKAELATYDYIGTKIAMGVATREEYTEQIEYTETLRARINELEKEL